MSNTNNNNKINKKNKRVQTNPNVIRRFEFKTETLVRRLTTVNGSISTGVTGLIAPGNIASAGVTGTNEWASYAARFTNYRVRSIEVQGRPNLPVNTTAIGMTQMYICPFVGGAVPVLAATIWSNPEAKFFGTHKSFGIKTIIPKIMLDAKLFTSVSAAIPAGDQFGLAFIGSTSTGAVSTPMWQTSAIWEAEFLYPL